MSLFGRGNGRAGAEKDAREDQRDNRIHAQQVGEGDLQPQNPRKEYLRQLTKPGVDESVADQLAPLLSSDLVLANFQRAEVDELKWLARWLALIVQRNHPPERSGFVGEYRAFLADDPADNIGPMGVPERIEFEGAVLDIGSRATRGEEGFQQKEMSRTYRVSEVKDDKESKSKLGGLFG